MNMGPMALTDSELFAIIIRTGTVNKSSVELAGDILNNSKDNGFLGIFDMSLDDLMKIKGIGKVKAIQIKCILELSRRISKSSVSLKMDFSSPDIIAKYYMEDMKYHKREHLIMVMLNTKYGFIGDYEVSKGTVNSSVVSPREIFIKALKSEAVYIILIHNHPSGDPTPSREDVITTKRVKEAGKIVGINLIDHIIIGDNRFVSLKQKQMF